MTAVFRDSLVFEKPITINGAIDMSAATVTPPTGQRAVQFVEATFGREDINAGTKSWDALPQNVIILAVHIVITTALTYSNAGTTGVSSKIGNADDDGFGASVALAGTAGYRCPAPGVLSGGVVAGGSNGVVTTFTATGGAPNLAHVSAGAGKIVIDYIEV